jgi:hypothetical protein
MNAGADPREAPVAAGGAVRAVHRGLEQDPVGRGWLVVAGVEEHAGLGQADQPGLALLEAPATGSIAG